MTTSQSAGQNDRSSAGPVEGHRATLGEASGPAPLQAATERSFVLPPFQLSRALASLLLTASGFALYAYVLSSFWFSPALGIHEHTPWMAYSIIGLALVLGLSGLHVGLTIRSPHAKLALALLGFFVCVVIGASGGRFVTYTLRGTLNPTFRPTLGMGQRFPDFALGDQTGKVHRLKQLLDEGPLLIVVYRGDFCPYARYGLGELSREQEMLAAAGLRVVAVSADPAWRGRRLASFLRITIPLLSDEGEKLLGPLGLIQHHRNGEPDNAIPAYFILDRSGVVRWMFTSPYYRELPWPDAIAAAAAAAR